MTSPSRSYNMSRIRSSGNRRTELRLIELFRAHGITGWRRHWPSRGRPLFGRPDFVFPRVRVVVFVDGCFWHGCPRHYQAPASGSGRAAGAAFWAEKVTRNRARDREVGRVLRGLGWRVVRVWEHELWPTGRGAVGRIGRLVG